MRDNKGFTKLGERDRDIRLRLEISDGIWQFCQAGGDPPPQAASDKCCFIGHLSVDLTCRMEQQRSRTEKPHDVLDENIPHNFEAHLSNDEPYDDPL